MSRAFDVEAVAAEIVERTCREQGLPLAEDGPHAVATLVAIIRGSRDEAPGCAGAFASTDTHPGLKEEGRHAQRT